MATAAAAPAGTDRAARALAALRRAEDRTGARRVTLTDVAPVVGRRAPAVPGRGAPLGARTAERPALPVPPALAEVLPEGLRRGAVTQVTGSTALVLELVAHVETQRAALGEEPWTAVVGCPTIGLVAAAEAGVVLDRLVLVPEPGAEAATVLAALVDGVDVVVVGDVGLPDADRRRLVARARERGVALVAVTPWPGARAVVRVAGVRWRGIGAGEGRLRSRELLVERVEAGGARRAHVRVVLPAEQDGYDAPGASGASGAPGRSGDGTPCGAAGVPEPGPDLGRATEAGAEAGRGAVAVGPADGETDVLPLRLVG